MIVDSTVHFLSLFKQHFNPKLLSTPTPPLFRDCSQTFEYMWKQALKLWYKMENNPQRKARCEALKQEILDLYERAKIKEKEREGQTDHKTQEFGYHVAVPKGLAKDVYARLRFGRKAGTFRPEFRKNYAIYKIQRAKR